MLLVIFGAGASFDSVPHLPAQAIFPAVRPALADNHPENFRPPLANQLFDTRPKFLEAMRQFPECLEIVPLLRKPNVLVERQLAALLEEAKTFPRAHLELAAVRLYLHLALWECQRHWREMHRGINNYVTFLRELEQWRITSNERICFVSFNYDTMLEEAMSQVLGITFCDHFDEYVNQQNYILIKLHGSINWARTIAGKERISSPQMLIQNAASLEITDEYRFVKQQPMVLGEGEIGYPALSIPVERKDEFSCPKKHIDMLKQALSNVTCTVTVGWRAMEEDFLTLLQSYLPGRQQLLIVSGDDKGARETLANLQKSVPADGEIVPNFGFTGLINNIHDLQSFLRRPRPKISTAVPIATSG